MKKALIDSICNLMNERDNVFMLTADLGYGVMDKIINEHPTQFINVGICEQNLTSVAAGLALEGNMVFTYSIGNFPTLRCLEQIRNDVAYHHANVKIVAVGGGFSYGNLGMSHHATEDVAVMRAIPGMVVLSPSDCMETRLAVQRASQIDGPVYIRLGRGGEPDIPHENMEISKVMAVRKFISNPGDPSMAVIGTGVAMPQVDLAVQKLQKEFNVAAYSIAQIKPIDEEGILKICKENDVIVTVEEHNVIGGLGSAVSEIIAENNVNVRFAKIGMRDQFTEVVGSPDYLRGYYGLDCGAICKKVREMAKLV